MLTETASNQTQLKITYHSASNKVIQLTEYEQNLKKDALIFGPGFGEKFFSSMK